MPETPDWAAAAVGTVQVKTAQLLVPIAGSLFTLGIATAGRTIVLVGADLTGEATTPWEIRGVVEMDIFDTITTFALGALAVSPESPHDAFRPPVGALHSAVGADLQLDIITMGIGVGTQSVIYAVWYYYE